jgi:hypothetical protein
MLVEYSKSTDLEDPIGVNVRDLIISLMLAVAHSCLELMQIYFES